ncbi:MAG TPA: exodeoxyribonuclease VII small subunit [Ignavibacteriaceae bacterium]|nr:exodeoxyribonuclease VII small subunit [Ignavibacteriaceae bacterium]
MNKKTEDKNFESNLRRLEEITSLLEGNELSLNEALSLYEEGINLSKDCLTQLKNAELKIKELKQNINVNASSDDENNGDLF